MKLQILVSSLNQEVKSLAEKMNLQANTILINQCNENRYEEWTQDGHQIRCYHLAERGVGLSRNNALLRADADLCLFSDQRFMIKLRTSWMQQRVLKRKFG